MGPNRRCSAESKATAAAAVGSRPPRARSKTTMDEPGVERSSISPIAARGASARMGAGPGDRALAARRAKQPQQSAHASSTRAEPEATDGNRRHLDFPSPSPPRRRRPSEIGLARLSALVVELRANIRQLARDTRFARRRRASSLSGQRRRRKPP